METILDLLLVYGPTLGWDDLWFMLPDQLKAYPNYPSDYEFALGSMRWAGWVDTVPRETVALTANAWLKLNIGEYPWPCPT
jgi:hypothetical protein